MKAANWLICIVLLLIGVINIFWGNDPFYGVFVIGITVLITPAMSSYIERTMGIKIPTILKVLIILFILWSALGVAELFDKIQLMLNDFRV